jgi:predicted AAA+ superfamily ATPase
VDFICKKNDKIMYVQVAYLLENKETKEREF